MYTARKFWLVLIGAIGTLAVIACSCNSIIPSFSPTATLPPPPTLVPPTALPSPTIAPPIPPDPMIGLAGSWLDPDTTGTVSTIIAVGGGYEVDSVINPNRGGNELTSTDWSNGVLTWTYCVPGGSCVTTQTVSLNGDSLETTWSNDSGQSGSTTMERVGSPPAANQNETSNLAGHWLDPDTTGTVATIIALDGGYTVDSVINPNRGGNELAVSDWSNGILTWIYCVPGGACITTEAVPGSGDSLATHWSNDQGDSGSTTLQRVASAPALSQEAIPGLAGRWLDPDTSGTFHLIVWENNTYIVAATLNPNRGGNEITSSSCKNNVLTWTYCVPGGACVTTTTAPISVSGGILDTSWTNDQGDSGTTIMQRMP